MKKHSNRNALLHFASLLLVGATGLGCSANVGEETQVSSLEQAITVGCDPVNTYCQTVSSQACELTADVVEKVGKYVCILVPDPKWYNPGNMKTKCLTEYEDKLIKGTSTCSSVLGLSCPSVTGLATVSCDAAMNIVASCMKDDANACLQAHADAGIAATFGPMCATYAIYQTGILEATSKSRIYNLVDAALDVEIKHVFGALLGDASFDDYVRGTVEYYTASDSALDATFTPDGGGQRGKTTPGKVFFNTATPERSLLIHELTHIWQYRHRGVQGLTADTCLDTFSAGNVKDQYKFSLVAGKKFAAYGVEQQAEMVQTYFLYKNGLVAGCPSGSNFESCASYASDAARVVALHDMISGTTTATPSTGQVLFSGSCFSQGCAQPAQTCIAQNGNFQMSGNNFTCTSK